MFIGTIVVCEILLFVPLVWSIKSFSYFRKLACTGSSAAIIDGHMRRCAPHIHTYLWALRGCFFLFWGSGYRFGRAGQEEWRVFMIIELEERPASKNVAYHKQLFKS
jgi:hypothetical protein